jgi:hypothetical protein
MEDDLWSDFSDMTLVGEQPYNARPSRYVTQGRSSAFSPNPDTETREERKARKRNDRRVDADIAVSRARREQPSEDEETTPDRPNPFRGLAEAVDSLYGENSPQPSKRAYTRRAQSAATEEDSASDDGDPRPPAGSLHRKEQRAWARRHPNRRSFQPIDDDYPGAPTGSASLVKS